MKSSNEVELADRISRRRVLGNTLAAVAFLAVQLVARPVLRSDGYGASGWRAYAWPFNSALLLLLLLPIGGYVWGRGVRALVNDEISRSNSKSATAAAFWVAMCVALLVYLLAPSVGLSARAASFLVVTPSVGVALLVFAWLESRALRDG
jgi:hypothetical protein